MGEIMPFQSIWVRICHWGFTFSLTGVLLTGLELHKPASFLALNYGKVLLGHVVFSWLALGFVAIRLVDALIDRDRSLIPRVRDFRDFFKLMTYYLFLRSSPLRNRKYNSGQVLMYFTWILFFLIACLLGLASYWQGSHLIWVWGLVGGFQILRWIKFSITIFFLATIPLHIYLAMTEDLSHFQAMITGYERKAPPQKVQKNFPRQK